MGNGGVSVRSCIRAFLHSCILCAVSVSVVSPVATVLAQPPTPVERVTFQQAIDRATRNNPSAAVAAAVILRADGLLRQARAATLPQVNGGVVTTTLDTGVSFQGSTVTPQNQATASLTADMPIVAAAAWARRTQAQDNVAVAQLAAAETRRQIGCRLPTHTPASSPCVIDANARARRGRRT